MGYKKVTSGALSTTPMPLPPASVSVPTLTDVQHKIYEFRRKGMALHTIQKIMGLTTPDFQAELEAVQSFTREAIAGFDDNFRVMQATDNIEEAIAHVFMDIKSITSPVERIKAWNTLVSMNEKLVRIYQDLGLVRSRSLDSGKKSDVSVNILNNYGKREAHEQITNIVQTTLTSTLSEPEPLDAVLSEDPADGQ